MQDAESVNRRGLGAEHERAERKRQAAGGFRQVELGGSEVAFWTNQNQDGRRFCGVAKDFLQWFGVGLQRADELEIVLRQRREKIVRLARGLNFREPVVAALLAGFERDFTPTFHLF